MQRAKGKLLPFHFIDLLFIEMKRTNWISLNGAGVLPEYQGMGGNALLYVEMEKTMRDFDFEHADLTQVAEQPFKCGMILKMLAVLHIKIIACISGKYR